MDQPANTPGAVELAAELAEKHGEHAIEAARLLVMSRLDHKDSGDMGIALEAFCILVGSERIKP